MSDHTDNGKREGAARKTYTRPAWTRVKLRPEEAVLGACKTNSVGGPASGDCTVPSACSSVAS